MNRLLFAIPAFCSNQATRSGRVVTLSGVAFALLTCMAAEARTALEDEIFKASMPHAALDPRGEVVKVHRVQLNGYFEGKPKNDTRLAAIKQEVQQCVKALRATGRATNPPSEWPDYLIGQRQDIYLAANRSVRYVTGTTYIVNYQDCSLLESTSARAELQSSKGACSIDLVKKTAKGLCDATGHSDAKIKMPPAKPGGMGAAGMPPGMTLDPKMVAMAQSLMSANDSRTGEKKTISGLQCDVWNQAGGAENGTICLASGGSFVPSRMAGVQAHAGLTLQAHSEHGYKLDAVQAQLDDQVNARIFTPYLDSGFSIKSAGSQQ